MGGGTKRVRHLLEVGAPPPGDQLADQMAPARQLQNPGALRAVRARLSSAASAIERVEELTKIGLPEHLPGGLAAVAMLRRDELVQRVGAHRPLVVGLQQLYAAQRTGNKVQGKMRAASSYADKPRSSAPAVPAAVDAKPSGRDVTYTSSARYLGVADDTDPEIVAAYKDAPKEFRHVPLHRAVLVQDAPFTFTSVVGADAAFLFSLLGISLQSSQNSFFNEELRETRAKFWDIVVLPRHMTPRTYAYNVRPESFKNGR